MAGARGLLCSALLFLALLIAPVPASQARSLISSASSSEEHHQARSLKFLVPEQPLVLKYHGGAVLGAGAPAINVYILWYGGFSRAQKAILLGFVNSIEQSGLKNGSPSVKSWWKLTGGYKDSKGGSVPASVRLAGQATDAGSLGKNLKDSDLERLVQQALDRKQLPVDEHGLYFVLTSADVLIESFCRNSCGTHSVLAGTKLPYAWVGNSAQQCPGMCAWPFAPLPYPGASPAGAPAKPPNGDVGIDGMVINFAAMLAGASTNPHGNAYYQGSALAPLEAATACPGEYGVNAYPGYPGNLFTDKKTGGNYNVAGWRRRKYVVPALWNPATSACATSA